MNIRKIYKCLIFNLKAFLIKINSTNCTFGRKGRCSYSTDIQCKKGGIVCIKNFIASENCHFIASVGGILEIGDSTFFNFNCIVVARKSIKIGEKCSFGPNVCIYDHDHAFNYSGQIHGEYRLGDIKIGNNVWIGANTIILRNTNIGDNCVIGSGCIISGNIPANSIIKSANRINISTLKYR